MPKTKRNGLGASLKRTRILLGLTLREAEERTGVSNPYLSQLESGRALNPAPKLLRKLATGYDLDYEELLKLAGYL